MFELKASIVGYFHFPLFLSFFGEALMEYFSVFYIHIAFLFLKLLKGWHYVAPWRRDKIISPLVMETFIGASVY